MKAAQGAGGKRNPFAQQVGSSAGAVVQRQRSSDSVASSVSGLSDKGEERTGPVRSSSVGANVGGGTVGYRVGSSKDADPVLCDCCVGAFAGKSFCTCGAMVKKQQQHDPLAGALRTIHEKDEAGQAGLILTPSRKPAKMPSPKKMESIAQKVCAT